MSARTTPIRNLFIATVLVAAAAVRSFAGSAQSRGDGVLQESWGAIYVGDRKIGRTHQTVTQVDTAAGPGTRSAIVTRLVFSRGGQPLEWEESAVVVEDDAGRVRRYTYQVSSTAGGVPRTDALTEGTVVGDRVRTTSGGYERTGSYPEGCLGPYAFHRRLLKERKRGEGTEFTALLFSPELGGPVEVTVHFGPTETVLVQGRRRRLQRVRQTLAIRPGHPDELWLDRGGEVLLMRSPVPMLGTIRIEQCSRVTALTPESPVELMTAAVLHSPAFIAAPRRLTKADYVLSFPADAVRGLYMGDGQQVDMLAPGRARVRVEVTVPDPADGYTVPIARDDRLAQWLRPTAFLESDHPLIREMAAAAAGNLTNSVALASALEGYVRREIHSKTLDMGFAGALEAARTRRGDCSEHAVLVAALGRALGVPSRIVVGLVYVDREMFGVHDPNGLFVFHVWTELLALPGAWVPVDAAMGGFDATHIALTKSALDTTAPLADLCLPVLDIVDNLRIESVHVEP